MSKSNTGNAQAVILTLGAGAILGAWTWWADSGDALLPAAFVLVPCLLGLWWTLARLRRVESEIADTRVALEESRGKALAGLKEDIAASVKELRQAVDAFPGALQNVADAARREREEAARTASAEAGAAATSLADMRAGLEESRGKALAGLKEDIAASVKALRASLDAGLAGVSADVSAVRGEVKIVGAALDEAQRKTLDEMRERIEGGVRQSLDASAGKFHEIVTNFNITRAAWMEEAEAEVRRLSAKGLEEFSEAGNGLRRSGEDLAAALEAGLQNAESGLRAQAAEAGERAGALWADQFGALRETLAETSAGFAERAEAVRAAVAESNEGARQTREAALKLIRDLDEKLAESARSFEARDRLNLELDGKVAALAEQTLRGTREMGELAHESRVSQTEMHAGVAMLNAGLNSLLERLETQAQAGRDQQGILSELSAGLAEFQERSAEILVENAMKTQEVLMDVLHLAERKHEADSDLPPLDRMAAVS